MPANLNALIRYKTINSCLFGGRRRWSIRELIDECSEALGDARGRYEAVSERTIREDIHIMRSDILGFNAPIEQKNGLYYYSDSGYSIVTLRITDSGLADRIYSFLISLRAEIKHPELEAILKQLCVLTNREYQGLQVPSDNRSDEETSPILFETEEKLKELSVREIIAEMEKSEGKEILRKLFIVKEEVSKYIMYSDLTWGSIMSITD